MDVKLELIHDASGEVFAESEVPLESLPQFFARMDTQLTVGDTDYQVVHAEPANREDIGRAGQVRLRLRPVVTLDPKKILFSLPTIEDVLPARTPDGGDAALSLTPDDFRQVELVPASERAAIEAEFDAIRAVLSQHKQGGGFTEIHVRKRIPEPLVGHHITRAEVESAVGAKGRPLGLRGQHGVVRGGFAIPHGDGMVYGVERDGALTLLGFHGLYVDVVGTLHAIALARGLCLVDWCNTRCLRAHEEGFVE
jgi:hypothetical protein